MQDLVAKAGEAYRGLPDLARADHAGLYEDMMQQAQVKLSALEEDHERHINREQVVDMTPEEIDQALAWSAETEKEAAKPKEPTDKERIDKLEAQISELMGKSASAEVLK